MLGAGVIEDYLPCWMFLWRVGQTVESLWDSVINAPTETGEDRSKEGSHFSAEAEVLQGRVGLGVKLGLGFQESAKTTL